MKKALLGVLAVVVLTAFVCGCATPIPVGVFYTGVKLPVATGEVVSAKNLKVGVSKCQSILGLVATGDASLQAAMNSVQPPIKTIYYVDWQAENILGVIGNYTTIVYGE